MAKDRARLNITDLLSIYSDLELSRDEKVVLYLMIASVSRHGDKAVVREEGLVLYSTLDKVSHSLWEKIVRCTIHTGDERCEQFGRQVVFVDYLYNKVSRILSATKNPNLTIIPTAEESMKLQREIKSL